MAESDWQPIETAPKDGTRILACSIKRKKYAVTWWCSKEDRRGYVGWGEFNERLWPAEYWMPLAELPTISDESAELLNSLEILESRTLSSII